MVSFRASRAGLWAAAVAVLSVAACTTTGDGAGSVTTTSPGQTPPGSVSSSAVTSPKPVAVEIATVVSWVQRWLDADFARSTPPAGVTGAYHLECGNAGQVTVGGVFACVGVPRTKPGFTLDRVGVVIYVLDTSGRAVWSAGTDVPNTTDRLLQAYERSAKGLSCRELLSPDVKAFPFAGAGRPDEDALFWSMVYWSLEGRPARMDPDGTGIPCASLHVSGVVTAVLEGGPVPLYLRH